MAQIRAKTVSEEEYLGQYAHEHYEWVEGELVKMSPVSFTHADLNGYLYMLLQAYFTLKPLGLVVQPPFVLRLAHSYREPDLMVILNDNMTHFTETAMHGAADICIEIVSPDSISRDHGEKFAEYQSAGVREYWIIDPLRDECRLYRLDENGVYQPQTPDPTGDYQTPLLPGLRLHIPAFWQDPLPNFFEIAEAVKAMLGESP